MANNCGMLRGKWKLDDELATIEMTRRKEIGFDEGQDAWDAKLGKRDSEPVLSSLDGEDEA